MLVKRIKNFLRISTIGLIIMLGIALAFSQKAYAEIPPPCPPCMSVVGDTIGRFAGNWAAIEGHVIVEWAKWEIADTLDFSDPKGLLTDILTGGTPDIDMPGAARSWDFWMLEVLPTLMGMSEQIAAVGLQQVQIIGTLLDAKDQLEAQRLLQKLQARTSKDYQLSESFCGFGSNVKSLAESDRKGEMTMLVLSQRSLDRMLGGANTVAAAGQYRDLKSRIEQFKTKYCDPQDNNNGLGSFCPDMVSASATQKDRFNKDVDYMRVLDDPWTLGVDFTDTSQNDQEEDLLALANNLYGYDTFERKTAASLEYNKDGAITGAQQAYLGMRSYVAKQNVAENSFNAIMGMKAGGSAGSAAFVKAVMKELGLPEDKSEALIGPNPSYFAQMEVLTKKIYQNPAFYTDLYDTPANVERKGVAIQAIGLMQKFDLLKSYLRTEASLSVLLELKVQELQNEIEDVIGQ